MDLYPVSSYDAHRVKTGPATSSYKFEHRNKDGKLQNFSFVNFEGKVDLYQVPSHDASGVKLALPRVNDISEKFGNGSRRI